MSQAITALRSSLSSLTLLILAAGPVHSDVLVVAPGGGPGVDHTTIQAAVTAAGIGDTVLVRSGSYAGFGIHNKGVNVIADIGANVLVTDEIAVRNVPVMQQVDLVGLTVNATTPYNRGMVLSNNVGPVWVEDCVLVGVSSTIPSQWALDPAQPGILAVNTSHLVLTRCQIRGGHGHDMWEEDYEPSASDGNHAVVGENSTIYVFDSTLTGGDGGSNYDTVSNTAGFGGSGLRFESPCTGFVSGSTFVGGRGGHADQDIWACGNGGGGGDGIFSPATSDLRYRDCTFQPGAGGAPGGAGCSWGSNGAPIGPSTHDAVALAGVAKTLNIKSPMPSGSMNTLQATGQPGDLCFAQVGLELVPTYLPAITSQSLIGLPRRLLFMGTLDINGELNRALQMPTISTPTGTYRVHMQGYFRDVSGNGQLGSGAHLLVLGSAF